MEKSSEPNSEQGPAQAAEHVAEAHQILKVLQDKIGEHPELAEAILKLETALNILTIKTLGLL
jgi:hypothetical protein